MENEIDCIQCSQNGICNKKDALDDFQQKFEDMEKRVQQHREKNIRLYEQLKEKDDLLTFERIKENMYKLKLEEQEKEILKLQSQFSPKTISEEEWEQDFRGTDEDNSLFY